MAVMKWVTGKVSCVCSFIKLILNLIFVRLQQKVAETSVLALPYMSVRIQQLKNNWNLMLENLDEIYCWPIKILIKTVK
jgi:hypothetical protein